MALLRDFSSDKKRGEMAVYSQATLKITFSEEFPILKP